MTVIELLLFTFLNNCFVNICINLSKGNKQFLNIHQYFLFTRIYKIQTKQLLCNAISCWELVVNI